MTIVSRGRKSAAQMAMLGAHGVEVLPRPKPPKDFNKEERAEWRALVEAMPADYFPQETHGILAQYVRHLVRSRWVAAELARMQRGELKFEPLKYTALMKAETAQSIQIKNLAAQMRLTQKSTDGAHNRRRANLAEPAWSRQRDEAA
jgi:hypothetical protein